MRQFELSILKFLGCEHERPRHRFNLPDCSLDHRVALTLADSTFLELHPDRTRISSQSSADLVFQCATMDRSPSDL